MTLFVFFFFWMFTGWVPELMADFQGGAWARAALQSSNSQSVCKSTSHIVLVLQHHAWASQFTWEAKWTTSRELPLGCLWALAAKCLRQGQGLLWLSQLLWVLASHKALSNVPTNPIEFTKGVLVRITGRKNAPTNAARGLCSLPTSK